MHYSVGTSNPEMGVWDPKIETYWMKQTLTAFFGRCIVVADADTYWHEKSQDYRSPVLESPTWRKLYGIAKKQQLKTRDFHHIFFEGFYDTGKDDETGARILRLSLGS